MWIIYCTLTLIALAVISQLAADVYLALWTRNRLGRTLDELRGKGLISKSLHEKISNL